ncbi:MAG: sigma-70 family RNA polymerase sigma factor [Candidatus Latescibacteria bacterium]|nr:sigma-70 family RNA polymerase sigma factor [Candidatus Latescibacterota bacterium]NIO56820.1 sigma-70 family RNA polymerase sigma factor [Candidatus Latescibacterota bacterium]
MEQPQHTTSESRHVPNNKSSPTIDGDLNLVKAISDGSLPAWHQFIENYSGLIYGVARRCLFSEDEDEVRSVYVDILESLYDGEIKKYRGEGRLSTWLIVATRSRALDFYRKRYGRYRPPKELSKLCEFDQKVLRLYYLQKLPLEIVIHALSWSGFSADVEGIVESIQRIESVLDRRYLTRIDNENKVNKYGIDSIWVLKYMIQLRVECEEKAINNRPDRHLLEDEVADTANRVRALISRLTPRERKVIFLRFNRGWTAKKISERLKLNGQRHTYAIIDRVIRKLRKTMLAEEDR